MYIAIMMTREWAPKYCPLSVPQSCVLFFST